ncbi:T-complex protein 1, theta subunit [Batrachochytrium salamandrivorans]|nr:T-complex protein 1, theta subunit [Batrachochytrium salamandrivorans]
MATPRVNIGAGLPGLLKDGSQHFTGVEGVIIKNIDACGELGALTRTSLGPNGMNKLIQNHLDKIFVTSDAATIMNEMEVVHPAAKMIVLASKMQEAEFGDGSNFVCTFATELLHRARAMVVMGLHPSEIVTGYKKAAKAAEELLPQLVCGEIANVRQVDDVSRYISSAVGSKFLDYEPVLSKLVSEACEHVLSSTSNANPGLSMDSVRICKMPGGSVHQSTIVKGLLLQRAPMGTQREKQKAGIAVFGANLEASQTETKGTVLINNADELLGYTGSEEDKLEEQIRGIRDSGVDVIVSGGSVSEMALHFCEKYNLLVLKSTSKFELRRICNVTGAFPSARLGPLSPDEVGHCDLVVAREIGGQLCTIFEQHGEESKVATIVLRSSTRSQLEDLERACDDGIHTVKTMCQDKRFLPGAGACEIELALRIAQLGEESTGLEQYPILRFAEALEVIPRTLSENCGLEPNQVISKLYAAHKAGKVNCGVDIDHDNTGNQVVDDVAGSKNIYDAFANKLSALRLASDVAITILTIDQLIMSKAAGGPALPRQ